MKSALLYGRYDTKRMTTQELKVLVLRYWLRKHIQQQWRSFLKSFLDVVAAFAVVFAVVGADKTFQGILVWELLFFLGQMLETFVVVFQWIRCVDARSYGGWKFIKGVQTVTF